MAERFGGKYSPGGPQGTPPPQQGGPYRGKRRSKVGARINFLFLVPMLFVLTGFQQEPVGLALNLAAFAVLTLATWLTKEGIIAQEAYEARTIARRPAMPRKIFGSVLTGIGLFLGGLEPGAAQTGAEAVNNLLNPIIFAALGFILHFLTFGPDPMRNKGAEGIDQFENDRVARAVDEGEKHLVAMRDAILRSGDNRLIGRVDRFIATARSMFRRVEDDPRDLTASRKYLGVYLLGARDATVKFADLYARNRDQAARKDYEALLDDLEANFTARTQYLLQNDRDDLDIEIEVLRERLQREGVKTQ